MKTNKKLSDYKDATDYTSGADVIRLRPEHSLLIMEVIANISSIENARGHILGAMLGTSAFYAVRVFMEIKARDGKKSALKSLAKDVLTKEDAILLSGIESKTQSLIQTRDAFAHGIWAVSSQLSDAILRLPADRFLGEIFDESPTPDDFIVGMVNRRDIDVFHIQDLEEIAEESRRALVAYNSFGNLLSVRRQFLHKDAETQWRAIGLRHEQKIMPSIRNFLDN